MLTTAPPARPWQPDWHAVLAQFRRGADIIVCGHYHVPRTETYVVDGREAILYILGDWSEGLSYLAEEDGRWLLRPGQ